MTNHLENFRQQNQRKYQETIWWNLFSKYKWMRLLQIIKKILYSLPITHTHVGSFFKPSGTIPRTLLVLGNQNQAFQVTAVGSFRQNKNKTGGGNSRAAETSRSILPAHPRQGFSRAQRNVLHVNKKPIRPWGGGAADWTYSPKAEG
jgi:hypothetical protein